MESGDRILVAAGLTAAVVVGAFVLWGPGGAPRVRKRRGQIAGLQNLGRTCFLNTLLQALAACPAFIAWLKRHARPTAHNSMITTLYTVIEVVNGTHESARGTPVCPLGVLQSLRGAGWVVPMDQQDAHELLHVLLTCIEEETVAMAKRPGCLSDALGLHGTRAWSALASPASPPRGLTERSESQPRGLGDSMARGLSDLSKDSMQGRGLSELRGESMPDTPGGLARPTRPASATPAAEPDLIQSEPCGVGGRGLAKGLSRSFCHLGGSRRWLPPAAPRTPPPPPFRGSLASRLQCTVCNTKSPIRYDKFDSITLSMTNSSVGLTGSFSLQGLLRAFTAPEMVKGVRCSKCAPSNPATANTDGSTDGEAGQYTQHIRTTNIGKLPACLCLHVSRVEWAHGGLTKRGEHVAFTETLSLAPYAAHHTNKKCEVELMSLLGGGVRGGLAALQAGSGGQTAIGGQAATDALYRLQAVVVHVGGPRSGHFATYRRGNGFEANRWWYTSDTLVHEVSIAEVLRCAAYLLFYERANSAAPRPLPPIDTSNNF